jgi:SAM-dependent methyltransferase
MRRNLGRWPFVAPNAVVYSYQVGRRFLQMIPPPKSLLEVGCGAGAFCFRFAEAFPNTAVSALDHSDSLIKLLQGEYGALHPNLSFRAGDFCGELPHLGTFEVVYSSDVLEHVSRPDAFVENLWRHLSPGGHAIVNFPNVESHGVNHFGSRGEIFTLLRKFDQVRVFRVHISGAPYRFYPSIRSWYEFFFAPESRALREEVSCGPSRGVDSFERSSCYSFLCRRKGVMTFLAHCLVEALLVVPPIITVREHGGGTLKNAPRLVVVAKKKP